MTKKTVAAGAVTSTKKTSGKKVSPIQAYVKGYFEAVYDNKKLSYFRKEETKEAYRRGRDSGASARATFTKNFYRTAHTRCTVKNHAE